MSGLMGEWGCFFVLNFDEERLDFDIHNGNLRTPDDNSPEYAEILADIQEFLKWYFLNGCLEVRDSDAGEQIGRKDEFIPVNVIVQPERFDRKIKRWRSEAERRRKQAAG